jgi:threonine synthase
MAFVSTSDPGGRRYGLAEAVRRGPAPDGGLFLPEGIAPLPEAFLAGLPGKSLAELGTAVLGHLLDGELPAASIAALVEDALDFPIPLRALREFDGRPVFALELFHGPTLAFKDVGARFLARLLPLLGGERGDGIATVLVATSGDTGGAVAQAFFGVEGTRVVVLYPRGKVSPVQERQFASLGGNVAAFAVDGAFDDCQALVKQAFADAELSARLGLTSANSINVGRLLPQAVYYFHAAAQLPAGAEIVFSTPSGNFGNLTAGAIAKALGLRCRFVAATNTNDVVPAYLAEGVYTPRPSIATLSNAMDVGAPNNLPRLLHLYGHDLEALRRDVEGQRVSDAETVDTLRRVHREQGYLLDPHGAVGYLALERGLPRWPEATHGVVLATAHPAKFGEVVEPAIGEQVALPPALARHLESPLRSMALANDYGRLRAALWELA